MKSLGVMKKLCLLLLTLGLLIAPASVAGAQSPSVIYVQGNASGGNDGSSWADAYTDLQSALAAAVSGDQIWVAAGTYRPTGGSDRNATFGLKNGVAVYGGFAGTETSLDERNWRANVTTLSGDIGTPGNAADNAYHVVTVGTGITSFAVLDGFTIRDGNGSDGGGIYYDRRDASPGPVTLRSLIVTGNSAVKGGGAYFYSYPEVAPASLVDCAFIGNQARSTMATASGGAIYALVPLTLTNVVLSGNYVGPTDGYIHRGSAIYISYFDLTLNNVTVSGNHVQDSDPSYGGVIYAWYNASLTFNNTILWGNTMAGGGVETRPLSGTYTAHVHYSDVQNGTYAGSNGSIEADPLFVSAASATTGPTAAGDLRLGMGSPAIDAGSNALVTTTTDLDGNPRIQSAAVDMGAYEAEVAGTAPVITLHPQSQTVMAGISVSFTAAATGEPAPAVQWEALLGAGSDWTTLTGATEATLDLGSVSASMSGYQYRAVFTNSLGSVTSDAATLTVTEPLSAPVVTSHPADQSVIQGGTATFTATATGNPTPAVLWQYSDSDGASWAAFGVADETTLVIGPVSLTQNGWQFRAVFTNSQGTATTDGATLTVTAANTTPVVYAGADAAVEEGSTFFQSGSFTDPDAGTWTATVNYGDGSGEDTLALNADKTFALIHTYADDGTYTVTVTVNDGTASGSSTVQVTASNVAPVVSAGEDAAIDAGGTFSGSGSFSEPGDDSWTATVDYGDGSGEEELTLNEQAFALSHVYAVEGSYTVTVTVTDDDGGSGSDSLVVSVSAPANSLPVVDAAQDATVDEGSWFQQEGSFTDPDADAWVGTVDYGDGSGVVGLPLMDKSFLLSHEYADDGIYTVTVSVNDGSASAIDTIQVTVSNVGPTVNAGEDGSIAVGGNFSGHAYFSDPGDDTYTATVDYGDGSDPVITAPDPNGKQVVLYHTYTQAGIYTVTVTVTDDDGGFGSDTVTVEVAAAVHMPVVLTHPTDQTAAVRDTVTFSAAAEGVPAPTVQWQVSTSGGRNWKDINDAVSESCSFTAQINQNGNQYRPVFTNSAGAATSNAAVLTVLQALAAPVVTVQPTDQSVSVGGTAGFTAAASGNPTPSVQWQTSTDGGGSWAGVPGATSTTLTVSGVTPSMNGYQYRAVFCNSEGTAISNAATLRVTGSTADLSITKSGVYDAASKTITWTVTVSNAGCDAAEEVVVTDNLAKGTKAISVTHPASKVTGPVVTVTLGALEAGHSVSFDIVTQLNPVTVPPVENTATVTGSSSDPDLSNNAAVATVTAE